MNYSRIYDQIVAKFVGVTPEGYWEEHHIVPRCMRGDNHSDNLVNLPARYHFVAHQCLAKIFGGKLDVAAFLMSKDGKHGSRDYEWLRRRYAADRSAFMKGNKIMVGRKLSRETRALLSKQRAGKKRNRKKNTGRPAWNSGRKMSPEFCLKVSQANKGRKKSAAECAAIALRNVGNTYGKGKKGKRYGPMSEEGKRNIAEAMRKVRAERSWSTRKKVVEENAITT